MDVKWHRRHKGSTEECGSVFIILIISGKSKRDLSIQEEAFVYKYDLFIFYKT